MFSNVYDFSSEDPVHSTQHCVAELRSRCLALCFVSKIVLVAIQDSADKYGSVAIGALKRLGAREPIILEFRSSFALAGFAGSGLPSWVSQAQNKRFKGPSVLSVTIEGGNYQATVTCIHDYRLFCLISSSTFLSSVMYFIYLTNSKSSLQKLVIPVIPAIRDNEQFCKL